MVLFLVRPPLPAAGLAAMLGLSLAWQLRRVFRVEAGAIRKLVLTADGGVLLGARADPSSRACRLIGSRVFAGAIILKLGCESGRRALFLVLPRDALDPEQARQLRSYVRSLAARPPEVTA